MGTILGQIARNWTWPITSAPGRSTAELGSERCKNENAKAAHRDQEATRDDP